MYFSYFKESFSQFWEDVREAVLFVLGYFTNRLLVVATFGIAPGPLLNQGVVVMCWCAYLAVDLEN